MEMTLIKKWPVESLGQDKHTLVSWGFITTCTWSETRIFIFRAQTIFIWGPFWKVCVLHQFMTSRVWCRLPWFDSFSKLENVSVWIKPTCYQHCRKFDLHILECQYLCWLSSLFANAAPMCPPTSASKNIRKRSAGIGSVTYPTTIVSWSTCDISGAQSLP